MPSSIDAEAQMAEIGRFGLALTCLHAQITNNP